MHPAAVATVQARQNGAATGEAQEAGQAEEPLRPPPERQEDLRQAKLEEAKGY